MIVSCPACQTRYDIDASRLRDGRGRLRCARCQTVFPVSAAPAAAAATPPQGAGAGPARGRGLDVALLALEPGSARDALAAMLGAERVRTLTADDGLAALEIIRRTRPHLALVAHRLVGASGPEIITRVSEDPALARVRLVLLGGPASRARRGADAASAHGADAHVAGDAQPATILPVLLGVLGLPGGQLEAPPADAIARLARLAAGDLSLYHPAVVEEARREGQRGQALTDLLEGARRGCLERHPQLRAHPAQMAAFGEELERALGLRA